MLKDENIKMKESNIKLNAECKEFQTDLNEMTEKYERILRKSNIRESNYMKWDSDSIGDFSFNTEHNTRIRRRFFV